MSPFEFELKTRIVFGEDAIDQLGTRAVELHATNVLVVSDPGVVNVGHVERGIHSLRKAGLDVRLFGEAHENPTTDDVDAGLEIARDYQPDLIVGLGGGSSMDCAKGINFFVFLRRPNEGLLGGRQSDWRYAPHDRSSYDRRNGK